MVDTRVSLKVPWVFRRDYPGSTYKFFCPGVDISRCKDHGVFRIHRIAGSRLRKVIRYFVPGQARVRLTDVDDRIHLSAQLHVRTGKLAAWQCSITSRTVTQLIDSVTHHSVSARTIRRLLQQSGLSARRPLLDLPLTQNDKRLRCQWHDERRMWVAE
ncbi:transposable element Tcb1 transposase [Trichonephila clavipes]|uniref:Transposable element Tcb1 transposase n=1 Tax=Trichonephila clavipes TaxID=2585209 RepID=A0A8X7BFT3_TRICX|nr:transposable element Tcb1 transposase [Trichonephila clavipes]